MAEKHTPSGSCCRRLHDPCTEEDCRRRHRAYCKRLRIERERGNRRTVPAGPVRDHLAALTARMSLSAVAATAGVSQSALTHIASGATVRVTTTLAEAVLAIRVTDRPPMHQVAATGSRRRLQALATMAWTATAVAEATGASTDHISLIQTGRNATVPGWLADAIERFYDEHWHHRGPDERVARRAARRGWPPSLAWDEAVMDDPDAKPVRGWRDRGAPSRQDRRDLVREMHEQGFSDAAIGLRLGISKSAAWKVRHRHNIGKGVA